MDFSAKLSQTRKAKGLTQEEVAEKCNLNVRTIQRIESGAVKPREYTKRLIAEALGFELHQPAKAENRSFIWHIKDLFNFKTHKMRKLTVLSSTALLMAFSIFLISSQVQAQTTKASPETGLNFQFNHDQSLQRVDVVFNHDLNLDSLMDISEKLARQDIKVTYRNLGFDENGYLTSIECEVSKDGKGVPRGSFAAKELATTNKSYSLGFYYDYSKGVEKNFCTGACW